MYIVSPIFYAKLYINPIAERKIYNVEIMIKCYDRKIQVVFQTLLKSIRFFDFSFKP